MSDFADVQNQIANLIGTPVEHWDERTTVQVQTCIQKGINSVVHNGQHQWYWLRPVFRFKTASGQRRYTLPLDFEEFIDDISFDGDQYQYPALCQKPATRLIQMQSAYVNDGTPQFYATEWPAHDGVTEQMQQLVLHPTPDAEYSLVGIYQVGPIRPLTSESPFFPGGPSKKQLFLDACLAEAELWYFDQPGDKAEKFQTTLVNAIAQDLRAQPRNMGPLRGQPRRRARDVRDALGWRLGTTYDGGTDL